MLFTKKKHPSITIGHWGWKSFRFLPFVLDETKINTHCRVHGISGSGKSKYLARLVASHILQGSGVMFLDPHGDTADDVLYLLMHEGFFNRPDAYQKLIYVDFSRKDRFLPLNWLSQPAFDLFTIARNFVDVCFRVWTNLADGSAPQFEQIMLSSISVLVACDLPLTALPDVLTDKSFRDFCLSRPSVPYQAVRFFTKEFDHWRDQAQMIGSTMRRVFNLTFGDTLSYTLGQRDNMLDFRSLIDNGISVIINVHGLDKITKKLLGCLVTTGMEQAAISRPVDKRSPYYFCIDEFPVFMTKDTEAYETFLEQARKFQVFLILAHQTNHQIVKHGDESLLKAMGNMKLEIHFSMIHDDAVYEAGRAYEPQLYEIKLHERTHTQLMSWQEVLIKKAWELKRLRIQQAIVKFRRDGLPWYKKHLFPPDGVRKIQTVSVKITIDPQALKTIKETYAKRYMRSIGEIAPEQTGSLPVMNASFLLPADCDTQ